MPDAEPLSPLTAGAPFGRIAATIAVSDLTRALNFYVGVLGMRVIFENGDPVGFVILQRDQAQLHLTLVRNHQAGTHNVAHLLVADASGLRDHLATHLSVRYSRQPGYKERA